MNINIPESEVSNYPKKSKKMPKNIAFSQNFIKSQDFNIFFCFYIYFQISVFPVILINSIYYMYVSNSGQGAKQSEELAAAVFAMTVAARGAL